MKTIFSSTNIFLIIYLAGFLSFSTAIIFPQIKSFFIIERLLWYTGLVAPDVFNEQDLKMSEKWFVVLDDQNNVIPLNGFGGERLSLHRSDLIYYANSLRWRRSALRHNWNEILSPQSSESIYLHRMLKIFSKKYKKKEFTIIFFEDKSTTTNVSMQSKYQPIKRGKLVISVK